MPSSPSDQNSLVPYDAVDVEIRHLVGLLNRLPGISTTSSCAGHDRHVPQTVVSFRAETQCALCGLIKAMPFLGSRGRFLDRPIMESIYVTVEHEHNRQISYQLRVTGAPFYMQRQLLGEVEQSVITTLEAPERHPSCPTCEQSRRPGM
jgi:hypothetical protein